MLINYLRYSISITIDNLITNNLDKISKTITRRNVNLEKNVPIELDKKNILNYFARELKTYCTNNKVDMDNLALDGYEIESKTKGVDIYFKMEDVNNHSYEPSIMANLLVTKDMPVLRFQQIDDTTIKWYFDDNESINYLKDEKDNIIAELPLHVTYYLESDLKPGGTYTRYIETVNQFNEKLTSTPSTITLKINQKISIYDKFKVEKRREDIEVTYDDYSSKLKAFASGIGDNEDCRLYKADDLKFSRRFLLYNKIYGVRASNDIRHNAVRFYYRYKLKGVVDYMTYDAQFTVKVKATRCVDYIDDPDPSLFGTPLVSEKELTYTFDNETQVANIYMYQFFPNLLPRDYKRRYKFEITITNIKGKSRIYSRDLGYHNLLEGTTHAPVTFEEKGYFDHQFTISGIATKKKKEYIEYYPPLQYEALVGVVNGDFEEYKDGICNFTDVMYQFQTSPSVYDKKYYIEFEKITPAEGYVHYKFDHQDPANNYTEYNGDGVTFTSDAIFADDSEHREFITQTEAGPYIIDDNRMHKFHYDISGIHVELSAYKRFELDIVPSINDIVLLTYPKTLIIGNDGSIDMPVDITCRNLQSAIAKWTPSVHNGYYYYNQKEYFLYSKCVADGENMLLDSIYTRDNVSIKVVMSESGPVLPDKDYNFVLKTKQQLLLDEYHYEWFDNKVWPLPMEVYNDYYMEFAPYYEYYSSPFTFDEEPTRYINISWTEVGVPPSDLDVYAIAYDDVYGKWYPPIKIINGGPVPPELKPSKILVLKFVLKPSRRPKLQTRNWLLCSEHDWKSRMLKYDSYNLYIDEEVLMPKSLNSNGVFISEFMDMGDTIDPVKGRSIKFNPVYHGEVEFYVKSADSKVEIQDYMKYSEWEKVDLNTVKTGLKRFMRYMIVIKPHSAVYYADLTVQRYEYTGMKREEYLPGFGEIHVDAETRYTKTSKINHEYIMTHELVHDGKEHVLVEHIQDYVQNIAVGEHFDPALITDVSFYPYDDGTTNYDIRKSGDVAYITSRDITTNETLVENSQGGAEFYISDNKITLSPIPQQYAPVILYADDDPIPYTQVFFTDEKGKFVLTNTEQFESLGFQTLYLKYLDIDLLSTEITIDGLVNKDYTIINNIVKFNYEIPKGSIIKVKYKLKRTFAINYNYENDTFDLVVHKETKIYSLLAGTTVICGTYITGQQLPGADKIVEGVDVIKKIKIFFETNKLSACRQLTHISLNPIWNVRHGGYIYICDYQDPPQTVTVYPADDFIYANGKDRMNVLVQVLDKNNNPIENVNVNIVAAKGKLDIISDKTDINGIIQCKYTSVDGENCIDVIKATVDDTTKGEAKIVNRKL